MAVGSMDAGVGEERRYGGRITALVVLSCATAAMAGAIFGYDLGASGGVSSMEPFLREFFPDVYRRMNSGDGRAVSNYCKFDSQLLTLFTSSLYISGLLTALLLGSWVTGRHGRRPSMIFGAASCLAGAAVSSGAVNEYMTILGRALLGVGLGFANQAVLLYLCEMAPARYRGAFSNGFQFSLCLGSLAATVINYGAEKITGGWGWRLSLALAGVPAVLLAFGAIFLPETPNSLVQRGNDLAEVKALLQKIRGIDAVDDELDEIVAAAAESSARGGNGLRLIVTQRRYRPQLVMAILIPAFTQLSGINAVGFYAPELLSTIGLVESAALLCTVATVVVFTASTVVFMFFVDRFGRRALLLAGGIQDARLRGADRRHHGSQARRRGRTQPAVRGGPVRPHRRICGGVQLVLGSAELAGAERDLPAGGPVGRAEHHRGVGLRVHHLRGTVLSRHAVPDEGVALLLLRGVDHGDDGIRVPPLAGDEGDAH